MDPDGFLRDDPRSVEPETDDDDLGQLSYDETEIDIKADVKEASKQEQRPTSGERFESAF